MLRRQFLLGSTVLVGGTALPFVPVTAAAEPGLVTFLHANDVYEIGPNKAGLGGFAPFMTLLRQERARHANCITTFGGDLLSPSILSGLTRGQQMIELTNAIGVQVAVLGNHEFDFGPEVCTTRVGESRYPWLGTNVLGRDGKPAGGSVASHMIDQGGFKIGFIGVLTPATVTLSSPGPDITFAGPTAAAAAAAKDLKAKGADLVVALTHLDIADDRVLARDAPAVDIILGGHDHEPITFYEGGKLILKAGYDLHDLVAVDIRLERTRKGDKDAVVWQPAGWRYLSTAGVAPDPDVDAIVKRWNDRLDSELNIVIGSTAVELDSRRATVRGMESSFGDLVADAIRDATNADLAITNGGGIRADRLYAPGTQLTRKDILSELPFGNTTVLIELKGADLRAALENGVSQVENQGGRFPQVSGLSFTYDPKRPPGQRILSVEVGGQPLDPAKTYKVATNDFMFKGGDGYAALKAGKPIIDPSAAIFMATVVMGYVARAREVKTAVSGRIRQVE